MLVYVLTWEPYHDNSSISGVFTDIDVALATLQSRVDSSNINCSDLMLTEWDTEKNEKGRVWYMRGTQVSEWAVVPWSDKKQWVPVRKEFVLEGGE